MEDKRTPAQKERDGKLARALIESAQKALDMAAEVDTIPIELHVFEARLTIFPNSDVYVSTPVDVHIARARQVFN